VQSIPSTQDANGQLGSTLQAPKPLQLVSHRHELEQSMPPAHAPVPLQVTSQRPSPQAIGPVHAPLWLQVTAHSVAALQSTPA
jgi:hypothetical protein